MPSPGGLRRKIWVAFIVQMTAISFAAVIGVYAAATVIEDVLVKRILSHDAAYYLALVAKDPAIPPPDTYFVRGYLQKPGTSADAVPPTYRGLALGYHYSGPLRSDVVYVTDSDAGRLYLSIDAARTHSLVLTFAMVLCGLIIVIVYLTTWMTYRASRSALSPVIALANAVRDWDPRHPDLDALLPENLPVRADGDVESLAYALHGFATRLEEFVERERAFTRDASHELRTPLTVIKASADMLHRRRRAAVHQARRRAHPARGARHGIADRIVPDPRARIRKRAARGGIQRQRSRARRDRARASALRRKTRAHPARGTRASWRCIPRRERFRVLIGNLIRNACQYTERGRVTVSVEADRVVVRDTGVGMNEEEQARAFVSFFRGEQGRGSGHGIGLTIVKRIADRLGWEVALSSQHGVGTTVSVLFPDTQRL